ncbi:MAG: prephenate dehydrogenase/arogenate dehydrogenase family protein [Candidatus Marinimicrobia bacterium]|nr:prephenate dehydrogenase/arogenate dehydrogenase family protein [Candidatus Neomarinimicrobiota bacterium]
MNSIGIIGYGRFGKVLANILQKGFSVKVYDLETEIPTPGIDFCSLDEVLMESSIFLAVPIRSFKDVIKSITPKLNTDTTILDVCSVKKYPVEIMEEYLPETVGIIATHPMFGPDSFLHSKRLNIMMHSTRDIQNVYPFWKSYFSGQDLKVIEMDPDTHDRLASQTQGVTHYLGRTLRSYGIKKTPIDTQGFRELLDLVDQTCNDTMELFLDLQNYNPYTKDMIKELDAAFNDISIKLENK